MVNDAKLLFRAEWNCSVGNNSQWDCTQSVQYMYPKIYTDSKDFTVRQDHILHNILKMESKFSAGGINYKYQIIFSQTNGNCSL